MSMMLFCEVTEDKVYNTKLLFIGTSNFLLRTEAARLSESGNDTALFSPTTVVASSDLVRAIGSPAIGAPFNSFAHLVVSRFVTQSSCSMAKVPNVCTSWWGEQGISKHKLSTQSSSSNSVLGRLICVSNYAGAEYL